MKKLYNYPVFLALLCFLSSLSTAQAIPSYLPADNLFGWWSFNGNANDESSNGNNGVVNGASLASDRFDMAGKAYHLNGTNQDMVLISKQVASPAAFSISVWFKVASGERGEIVSFGNITGTTSGQCDRVLRINASGQVEGYVWSSHEEGVSSTQRYDDNQWHMAVLTLGTGGFKLYVDGLLVGTTPITSCSSYSGYWKFGGYVYSTWTHAITADIDDIAIWTRQLTTEEIAAIYATQVVPSYLPTTNLFGWWPFNGNANDESINEYNGIVNGASLASDRFDMAGKAYHLNGTNQDMVLISNQVSSPAAFSFSVWFKVASGERGEIVSFGNSTGTTSGQCDRVLRINASGQVEGYVWSGHEQGVASSQRYDDNQWHLAVLTLGAGGFKLYVDGLLSGTTPITICSSYSGYWKFGGYVYSTWTHAITADIDDIAIWTRQLTTEEIAAIYDASRVPTIPTHVTEGVNKAKHVQITSTGNGQVIITGTQSNDRVQIFSSTGKLVKTVFTQGTKTIIPLAKGIYIVNVNGYSVKIGV